MIREINKDPHIIRTILEECNSAESALFLHEYRNSIKAACLLLPSLYSGKQKFLHLYFNGLMYSIFSERMIARSTFFASIVNQIIEAK